MPEDTEKNLDSISKSIKEKYPNTDKVLYHGKTLKFKGKFHLDNKRLEVNIKDMEGKDFSIKPINSAIDFSLDGNKESKFITVIQLND